MSYYIYYSNIFDQFCSYKDNGKTIEQKWEYDEKWRPTNYRFKDITELLGPITEHQYSLFTRLFL